jgi:hypothetical protein
MIGRGNRSTRRKPAPMPLCPPQTPRAARTRTRVAAVGSQRLTAEIRHGLVASCYTDWSSDYVVSTMRWLGLMNCKGSGSFLIFNTIHTFAWMNWGSPRETSAPIISITAEIRTGNFPNIKQRCLLDHNSWRRFRFYLHRCSTGQCRIYPIFTYFINGGLWYENG